MSSRNSTRLETANSDNFSMRFQNESDATGLKHQLEFNNPSTTYHIAKTDSSRYPYEIVIVRKSGRVHRFLHGKNWIAGATKRKGRLHAKLKRLYGEKAFHKNGTIRADYLEKALKHAEREHDLKLEREVRLARVLKRINHI